MRFTNPLARWRQRELLRDLSAQIGRVEEYLGRRPSNTFGGAGPVIFFNASTRIHRLSLNGAFSLLASWGLRAAGQEVKYLVCHAGMSPCVLGTERRKPQTHPPCSSCQALSEVLFPADLVTSLRLDLGIHGQVLSELAGKSLTDLAEWTYRGRPLGKLCLPSVRWILRRHHLPDSEPVNSVYRRYLATAASLAVELETALTELAPRALALFNGIFFPEALAREIALERAIPVVTHEVGLAPNSAFFTRGEASFREIPIVADSPLGEEKDRQLDRYLENRFRGSFSMAGIRFWESMESIPEWLQDRRRQFRQTVAVFTNVVFDTSQVHANTIFSDMFDWLDHLAATVARHPETLFVFRAHPDEYRLGKESQESVAAWFGRGSLPGCPNAVFVEPKQPISSYELIRTSKLVLVYNSSVGLEASVLGVPTLCAGRARYTQVPSVFLPKNRDEYYRQLEGFLEAERIEVPPEFRKTARSFLYGELFEASLDLSEFIDPLAGFPGMVAFRQFEPERLVHSRPLDQIRKGFVDNSPFLLKVGSLSESGESEVDEAP